jgi:hypothetical protein
MRGLPRQFRLKVSPPIYRAGPQTVFLNVNHQSSIIYNQSKYPLPFLSFIFAFFIFL